MTLVDLMPPATTRPRLDALPVAIIGAGPIGLAAAAELHARDIPFTVLEAGPRVGDGIRSWGHVRLFSSWALLVDPAAGELLDAAGWAAPNPARLPTGDQFVDDYLEPLAALPALAPHIRTGVEVLAVSREGMDRTRTTGRAAAPFVLRTRDASGDVEEVRARAVIDASGTIRTPNRLGSNGLDPLGATDVADRIVPPLPDVLGRDRARFAGRRTLVVGAGHSAAHTLLALVDLAREEPGTSVTWAIRSAHAVRLTSSDDDGLPARASIGQHVDNAVDAGAIALLDRFEIVRLGASATGSIEVTGSRVGDLVTHEFDLVVNATGFRPDLEMLREIRLELDDVVEAPRRLAPLIDPNVHTCGTVEPHGYAELAHPEPGFFLAGMKSYGRAPTFLAATGYEQVRSIAAWLAGDAAGAASVELVLPATGACSTDGSAGGCC
ncbi:NAD(P)-binding domain-containing protein [Agromyces mangrovi Wang et al. 2018]|uniref:NAD(P)-binding domain-containing protein n=1 Tax=Agromyces mangrovi TaxID=1858653 RepID=UPI002573D119|nr:NAD(P)-binding domain-containing protein [Agromyces mangrovi]BDZ64410.1 flavoprotein [Agromyces mangrovi]